MLEIYLVRHGKTLFNEKDMVQGWCDSPLTKLGQKQAQNVGKNMKDFPFTLAFSSPSERASDTCEAIIQNRVPIILDKRLKEMNFGDLEGEKNSALFEKSKPESDFEKILELGWVEEGGENEAMVISRIKDFFDELALKYENETILIASHGLWINIALKYLEKDQYQPAPIENCSISKIIYDNNEYKVITKNDCSYRED